jgi:hypothetical protein
MPRTTGMGTERGLQTAAVFLSMFLASPSQTAMPSASLMRSRRAVGVDGLAFLEAGRCVRLVPGAPQGSRQRETWCPTRLSLPGQMRLMQRRGCERRRGASDGWIRHLCQPLVPGQPGELCVSHATRPELRGGGKKISWRESRASPKRRCRAALNLATSTSFKDDGESKPLGDPTDRRRGEMRIDVDDAEPHKSPELPRGAELDVHMVYTWDGDLMPSGRGFNDDSDLDEHSLADGEYAVYNDDGDEAMKFMPWELSRSTDSWDTYDIDYVDPLSIQFAQRAGFQIPADYNWNATTSENYRAPATPGYFFGAYQHVRERMDYSYHVNYLESRQVLQDEIVTHWREAGTRSERPWLIFTAGAMGAGKSHTIKLLQAFGCCSLSSMVKVDPDTVKYQLPEMQVKPKP